jgi:hypothetical protein
MYNGEVTSSGMMFMLSSVENADKNGIDNIVNLSSFIKQVMLTIN